MRKTRVILLLLTLFLWSVSWAQEISVSGKVKDKENNPLPGVNVIVAGTTLGTVTDVNGTYKIKVPDQSAILKFSFIGYKEQQITVGNQTTIDVTLQEETKELDEVVVIGYGSQKRSDLTGSVVSVKAEELSKIPNTNIASALQGKAAGVYVTQSTGAPGSGTTIRIRGISSISGGGNPMWVVDGIPSSSNSVNDNDIESIEILKDAAAAAIYGSSGANGVILITTKRGKAGEISANMNVSRSVQEVPNRIDVANSYEYGLMYLEYQAILAKGKNIKAIQFPNYKTDPTYDYQDMIFRNANYDKIDFNVSGGTEKFTSYFSGSYIKQQGILKATNYDKINFRLKSDYKVNDWLVIGENVAYTYTNRFGWDDWIYNHEYSSPINAAITVLPNHAPYDENGLWKPREWGNSDGPMPAIDMMNQARKNNAINAIFNAKVEPLKGLSFESILSPNVSFDNNYTLSPAYYYGGGPGQFNNTSKINRSLGEYFGYEWQNLVKYKTTFFNDINFEGIGGYIVGAGQYMSISGERWNLLTEDINNWQALVNNPEMWYFDASTNDTSLTQLAKGGASKSAGYSYIGRINLDYKSILLFQLNFRRDYSSKFGPENRAGDFPGFSGGLKFSELQFIKEALPFLSFGKVRYAIGRAGNNAVADYAYYSTVGAVNGYYYSLNNALPLNRGAAPDVLANRAIHWEDIETRNTGIDLQFFNNRLNLTIERFLRHNIGMLVPTTIPGYAGWTVRDTYQESAGRDPRPMTNIGKITNKGWDFVIGWKEQIGDFKYGVDFNYTYVRNIATDLGPDSVRTTGSFLGLSNFNRTETGKDIGNFYGFQVDRIFQLSDTGRMPNGKTGITNQPFSINSKGDTIYMQPLAMPGDFKFKDLNGDGKLTDEDKTVIGNPFPRHIFGLNINFSYKFIDFSMFWYGTYGGKILNFAKYYGLNQSGLYNWSSDYVKNHYRAEDIIAKDPDGNVLEVFPANTNAKYPRLDPTNKNGNFDRISDFYVEDGSYLRLRNIQIGFTLPQKLFGNKIGIKEFKIYLGATNLLTFTKYSGMDPEVTQDDPLTAGIDKASYPVARTYTVGATLKF